MEIHRLDLDVAIYRDRVQVTHRPTDTFVDQRAEYPFSTERSVVGHARFLEDTMVRAIRQILKEGGFSLRDPIARVVRCDGPLAEDERVIVEHALHETGMKQVIFELEE
ncbi:hypothetical protein [Qipengyuania sphaerica]|uniref:hypothetical protein n=1 Tax=Qipengyuania sphaerica TaxID=2867243 RepID=UPI001C875810|nr:hypothetical protein [Qipengyuania sphaerica]MBX7539556.1 hypothetical protein [Qipengyuania sphaerica]